MRQQTLSQHRFSLIFPILVGWLSSVQVLGQMTVAPSAPLSPQSSAQSQMALNDSHHTLQSPPVEASNQDVNVAAVVEGKEIMLATDYSILSVAAAQQTPTTTTPAISLDLSPNNTTPKLEADHNSPTKARPTTSTSLPIDLNASNLTLKQTAEPATQPPVMTMPTKTLPPETVISQQSQLSHCSLGDDSYQIGERWNPNLPPFGVQVCVLCECAVRQRKSCYEAKVTCRRITNECPVIDSCPDGKKPVTVAGQCCKSCQSSSQDAAGMMQQQQQQQGQSIGKQSPAYESQLAQMPRQGPTTSFRIVYMNERMKDYMSLVNSLPACPFRESDSPTKTTPQTATSITTTLAPIQLAHSASKASKGNRNDLNGIDTRLAFKSLQDGAFINAMSKSRAPPDATGISRTFDHSSDDHQHPNDVQSATASNRNQLQQSSVSSASYGSTGQRQASPNSCKLGNDTFHVGDVWNPILPPFGVQVCVQCNCIFRLRKGCFETKVTCRRINRDCPTLEVCPDGQPPINVDGQCCKTCPLSLVANNEQDQQPIGGAQSFQPTTLPLNGIMRNEKVYKEFHALTRNLNVCAKPRDGVDIYNTSRYARRSRRTSARTFATN